MNNVPPSNDVPPSSNLPPEPVEPIPPVPSAPVPPMTPPPVGTPMTTPADRMWAAITSLVLGIISLCGSIIPLCGVLLSILAIVFGVLGLNSRGRTMAIIGIALGAVAIILTIIFRVISPAIFNNLFRNYNIPGY